MTGRHRRPGRARALKPVRKVTASTAAAAAVGLGIWALEQLGVQVPNHVAAEATTVAVFAAGWLRRP